MVAPSLQPERLSHRPTIEANLRVADTLIPDVADAMIGKGVDAASASKSLVSWSEQFNASLKDLLHARLATRRFALPPDTPQWGQELLLDTLGLTVKHKQQLFEAMLDPTGELARQYRPTPTELQKVFSLLNPKLPPRIKADTGLATAFEMYAPKHTENLMCISPTVLLYILGSAEYQAQRAPYRGKIMQLTKDFYKLYNNSVPPELETISTARDMSQLQIDAFDHLVYFNDFDVALFGVGGGREQFVREHIKNWRDDPNITRIFSHANRPVRYLGFDIFPIESAAPWLDQYHQLSLDQIYKHAKLRGIAGQVFAFGSPYMDILEVVKYIESLLGASHILTRGGRFSDDQAFPSTYRPEIDAMQNLHPEELLGMFERDWQTGGPEQPHKYFYAMPIEFRYALLHLAGLEPESFFYRDARALQTLLERDGTTRPSAHAKSKDPWLRHISETYYQTQDATGRTYDRWTLTTIKKRRPHPFLLDLVTFLNHSPAFAPQPEQQAIH